MVKCPQCKGDKTIMHILLGTHTTLSIPCPKCAGTGAIPDPDDTPTPEFGVPALTETPIARRWSPGIK